MTQTDIHQQRERLRVGEPAGSGMIADASGGGILADPRYRQRWAMYESALAAGLPIVSREVCAIICAMLLVWGNSEEFTHNHRLVCELQYAQRRFHIEGSKTPDTGFATLLQGYVAQLELMQQREDCVPDHIDRLFQERYGFHFNRKEKK